jgi:putative membrane protein
MRDTFLVFIVRWLLNSLGLWVAVRLLGTGYDNIEITAGTVGFLIAGLIFSIMNTILKPLIIFLSLPAIVLTLGLFMFIVNGFMVYVALNLAPGLHMTFWNSIIAGILMSLVNYIVSAMFDLRRKEA